MSCVDSKCRVQANIGNTLNAIHVISFHHRNSAAKASQKLPHGVFSFRLLKSQSIEKAFFAFALSTFSDVRKIQVGSASD